MTRDLGVNLSGSFKSEKGVGEAARSDIRSLTAARVPFVLNPWTDFGSSNQILTRGKVSRVNRYPINLIHINADCFGDFRLERGPGYFEGPYNIGCWA